ncbi:ephexin-1 isoform X2 [Electrophorus electricus]|uniref:ephexin-1 isoform X2 n=1 Tax=Electrophorus electricus TaxID=8005 RepID=UPI0015CFD29F|nr:ephexin-1 isoform X2 [Electrophorus electricus]
MEALKPTLSQKPNLPPKPRLESPNAIPCPAVLDRAIRRIEPGTVRQRALSFINREETGNEALSRNGRISSSNQAVFQWSESTVKDQIKGVPPSRENEQKQRKDKKQDIKQREGNKERKSWNKDLSPECEEAGRSDPDGSEMDSVSGAGLCEEGSTAHSSPLEEKHCHCVCHLHRPGMKLVWVPLQAEENNSVCMDRKLSTNGSLKREEEIINLSKGETDWTEGKVTKTVHADNKETTHLVNKQLMNTHLANAFQPLPSKHTTTEKSPTMPQCVNCQSFRFHHGPHKEAEKESEYETMDTFFHLCSSETGHAETQSSQPLPAEEPLYLDLQPSNESAASPPTPPPRPKLPPRPCSTAHANQKERRCTQPVLAYMLSPRGGRPPMRSPTSFDRGSKNPPSGKPNLKEEKKSDDKDSKMKEETENGKQEQEPRRISHDWEPNSDYEPLYQMYQAKVCKEAAELQDDSPKAQRKSMSECLGMQGTGATGNPSRNELLEITLWQELPVVKESRVLQTLTHTEKHRQECMFEVLTSEASYLRSLRVLKDHFLGSRELDDTLVIHDRKSLFSNILQVYEVSERFMQALLDRVDENVLISDICDIIHHHAEKYFSVYIDYVRNQVYQEKTYSRLMQCNRAFAVIMRRLEESPLCRRLPFTSFMLLPFQRITRIKILIQSILKRTMEDSHEESTASQALATVSEIIREANTQVGKMKQMEELMHIANLLEFDKLKAIPLVSKTRCLEKQGELQELSKAGSLFGFRFRFTPIYIFLFNDLLILTARKSVSPERFVVLDHAHRSLVQVQGVEGGPAPQLEHAFSLTILENHQGNTCERLLKANTESDMHRWIAAFPSLTGTQEEQKEKVYEDWDCPQVQCICQYVAKQADELSLEPSDVINVIRKTNEGWYEGIRLSDRQRGWFPQETVAEVTNEHQRRRNLREQFRLAQAANHIVQR